MTPGLFELHDWMRAALGLLLLAFVASAPQLLLRDWRGTEARRVQIAREMCERGDYLVPTLGGEPTFTKPPFYYWILAGLQRLDRDFVLMRVPSVLGFWLLALLAFSSVRRHYGALAGWIVGAGILLSPMVLDHIPYAEIDAVFAALTGISILLMAEGASFSSPTKLVLAGVVGGMALLTKGPPYMLFFAGAALVWLRRLRLAGIGWFLPPLVLIPAAYYVPLIMRVIPAESLLDVARAESIGRAGHYTLGHVLQTPLYLVRALAMLMPLGLWSFYEYRGTYGPKEMREAVTAQDETFLRICAGAMVGAVILLMAFPSRPARYLLPGVACFLVALGPAVAAYVRAGDWPSLILIKVVQVVGIAASVGLLGAPWIAFPYGNRTPILLAVLAVAPLVVKTRRRIVLFFLLVPLAAAWTALADRAIRRVAAPYSRVIMADIMMREIRHRGADDLSTVGHVPAELLLASERTIEGDEHFSRPPTSKWLVAEDPDSASPEWNNPARTEGYVDRVRLRLSNKVLVLRQRQ